jgi:hypothetical protein
LALESFSSISPLHDMCVSIKVLCLVLNSWFCNVHKYLCFFKKYVCFEEILVFFQETFKFCKLFSLYSCLCFLLFVVLGFL